MVKSNDSEIDRAYSKGFIPSIFVYNSRLTATLFTFSENEFPLNESTKMKPGRERTRTLHPVLRWLNGSTTGRGICDRRKEYTLAILRYYA